MAFCNIGHDRCNVIVATFEKARQQRIVRSLLLMTAVDWLSGVLCLRGQLAVGPQLYTVLYASTMLWTALISQIRGRAVQPRQWLALCVIRLGVGADAMVSVGDQSGDGSSASSGLSPAVGVFWILCGSFLHAAVFCMSEDLLQRTDPAVIAGGDIGCFLGMCAHMRSRVSAASARTATCTCVRTAHLHTQP